MESLDKETFISLVCCSQIIQLDGSVSTALVTFLCYSLDDYVEVLKFSATSKAGVQVKTISFSSSESQVRVSLIRRM